MADTVSTAGSLVAAASAIRLAWQGRTRWEPSEEDVHTGGQRVAGLLSVVAIVLMWVQLRGPEHARELNKILIGAVLAAAILFLLYSFLLGLQTYMLYPGLPGETRIIGGFRLMPNARAQRKRRHVGNQKLLQNLDYEPDAVWTRPSRQFAKTACIALYMGLIAAGTIALAAAAIRISIEVG